MDKPNLLYVSPFWPMKSGISEYSESLVFGLKEYFDITLLVDNYKVENKKLQKEFKILNYDNTIDYSNYKYILYNFGNNHEYHSYMYDMILKYSGYVILHDFVLYYLTVGYYADKNKLFQKIYEMEGIDGISIVKESLKKLNENNLLLHKDISANLPLNNEVIKNSKGIIVHSNYSKDKINNNFSGINVLTIPHIKLNYTVPVGNDFLNKKFNIPKGAFIIGSIGFIGPSKQNKIVCEAVNKYNELHNNKIYYVMAGDGDYVNNYLNEYIFKTGFLGDEDFLKSIKSCNLIMNLRYPYNGEASGTLIHCMDLKKPCVVTDIGWFGELPDNSVIKVSKDVSVEALLEVIENAKQKDLTEIIENAYKYVNESCSAMPIAEKIYTFLKGDNL